MNDLTGSAVVGELDYTRLMGTKKSSRQTDRSILEVRINLGRVRRLRQILVALLGTYSALFILNIWTSGPEVLLVLAVTICVLMLAWIPLKQHEPGTAANIIITVTAVSLALIMWQGSGLRSSAMFSYPGLLIFCLMVGNQRLFITSYVGVLIYMIFLVYATHQGWRTGSEQPSSWLTLLEFLVIISAITLLIRLLAGDLFNLLQRLEADRLQARSSHRKAEHMAMHDKLTGLPNRRSAKPLINEAVLASRESGGSAALVFIDIDDFKAINDTHGHNAGDTVLRTISERIVTRLRKIDTLIRFAGDEFLLLLPHIDQRDEIRGLLNRLCEHINEPMEIDGIELTVAVSMGVVVVPDDGTDFKKLVAEADRAMYRAKAAGKNQYRFAESR